MPTSAISSQCTSVGALCTPLQFCCSTRLLSWNELSAALLVTPGTLLNIVTVADSLVPTETLVVSLVLTRLDFGNSVLAGLPVYLVRRLQSVLNVAARLTYHLRRSDHITDALVCLHWLRVPVRVQFKIAVLTFKVLHVLDDDDDVLAP